MVFILALLETLRWKVPLSIVVFRSLSSDWSNPCKNSTGSANVIDKETPFPDARGRSSPEPGPPAPERLGLMLLAGSESLEAGRAFSTSDGRCIIPLIGPPTVGMGLPNLATPLLASTAAMLSIE